VRTTIRIDGELYRRAGAAATQSGRSVGGFIEDAVREALGPTRTSTGIRPLPRFGGSGVRPGVRLTNPRSLLDTMDGVAGGMSHG
jgi:hypothetical protein